MTRVRALSAAAVCLLLASPILYGFGRNELVSSMALDELAEPIPPRVTSLRAKVGVQKRTRGCLALVARTLAVEESPAEVARKLRRSVSQPGVVWWQQKQLWGLLEGESEERALSVEQLPPTVHGLMVEHAFLPSGVARVVVWSSIAVPSDLDPRCW